MEQKDKKQDVVVDVEFDGAMEIKPFDITPYVGKQATIESVATHYNEFYKSYYLLVKTVPVAYVDGKQDKPVTASRIFPLMSDDGRFGWRKGGDLDLFLIEKVAKVPSELVGKSALLFPSKPNKEGVKFITF